MIWEGLREYLLRVLRAVSEVPLCTRCLGRCLAGLGTALDNKRRGECFLTLLAMSADQLLSTSSADKALVELLVKVAVNTGFEPLIEVLRKHDIDVQDVKKQCYICGSNLDEVISSYVDKVVEALKDYEVDTFLIGVSVPIDIVAREEELVRRYKLGFYESLKREVKREVGKAVAAITKLTPEFKTPDVLALIDLGMGVVEVIPSSLFIQGLYWKLGRRISQAVWLYDEGTERRVYASIEEALASLKQLFDALDVKLHASGREDIDVRMLGTGRPMIVEVKGPRRRKLNLATVEREVNRSHPLIKFKFSGLATRGAVRLLKIKAKETAKVYRALVYSKEPLNADELKAVEDAFRDVVVSQRTPRRVRHRRPDVVRYRKVYRVVTKYLDPRVFEALIHCQGGLYIKELVTGDLGDTDPSFSSVLGKELICLELDVLAVAV